MKHEISGTQQDGVRNAIDRLDRRILRALQEDCRISIIDLAGRVGLSPSAAHRRVRLLEERGAISRYAAVLDRAALGLSMEFFIEISLVSQSSGAFDAFEKAVQEMDEILECHLMAGGIDYLLRVAAADIADFERIHRERLARLPGVARITSQPVLRSVRAWRGYPVRG